MGLRERAQLRAGFGRERNGRDAVGRALGDFLRGDLFAQDGRYRHALQGGAPESPRLGQVLLQESSDVMAIGRHRLEAGHTLASQGFVDGQDFLQ
ncbi:MAG: hypothetical protein NBKEAIPA_01663 [Nitrospirae bacterium]|nr:hypothetical protein [Nitrospirota bacterium]